MRIGIRADGGSKIGMGHIMRTLVLARELKRQNNDVFYICRIDSSNKHLHNDIVGIFVSDKYKKGIEKIMLEGFKVSYVREKFILDDISNISADMLITDSYNVNEEYFERTKAIFNKTTYIDDTNLYNFNVDFLINQNIDAEDFNYEVNNYTKLMLGTKYILLREEFRNLAPKHIKPKAFDIMITVGGADPFNVTDKILSWVNELNYNFHVVVGPSFNNTEALKKFENNKIKLYDNADMLKIMQKCDIAVSACGSTLYELAMCGVPTIGIIIADNQVGIAEKFSCMGIIKSLGWYDRINKDIFIDSVVSLSEDYHERNKINKEASLIIDGKGAERISKILTSNSYS